MSLFSYRDVSNTAREQWERARGGVEYLVNEQPLALGAIGLAIGAILGAAAPRTRMEEQTIGQASRNLAEKAKEAGHRPIGIEGEDGGEWVLLDLQDTLVHVMLPKVREFYNLEKLWSISPAGDATATDG